MEALRVVEAWGFTLKTMKGFTWHKLTKTGLDHFGMGNYTRANTEDCLFADALESVGLAHRVASEVGFGRVTPHWKEAAFSPGFRARETNSI